MAAIPDSLMSAVRPFQHTASSRMNPDIDLKSESGLKTGIDCEWCHRGAALYIGKGTDLSAQ
jgi:hypothetical protein